MKTVGHGDGRGYESVIAFRVAGSMDAMRQTDLNCLARYWPNITSYRK